TAPDGAGPTAGMWQVTFTATDPQVNSDFANGAVLAGGFLDPRAAGGPLTVQPHAIPNILAVSSVGAPGPPAPPARPPPPAARAPAGVARGEGPARLAPPAPAADAAAPADHAPEPALPHRPRPAADDWREPRGHARRHLCRQGVGRRRAEPDHPGPDPVGRGD